MVTHPTSLRIAKAATIELRLHPPFCSSWHPLTLPTMKISRAPSSQAEGRGITSRHIDLHLPHHHSSTQLKRIRLAQPAQIRTRNQGGGNDDVPQASTFVLDNATILSHKDEARPDQGCASSAPYSVALRERRPPNEQARVPYRDET